MRKIRCFAMLSMTIVLASCSVKEDRSDCPCWLTVDAENTVSLNAWFGSHRILDSHPGGFVEHTVPRGLVELTAHKGNFTVEVGHQMDSLFAQRSVLNTNAETAVHTVHLNKNFATVELEFKQEDDGRTGYDLLVTGTVNGAEVRTLEPVDGPFSCTPEPNSKGRGYVFRVPRQKDDSLEVILLNDSREVERIPVGELIRKAGFDWGKQWLGDVHIVADIPAHSFLITIEDWEGPESFSVTI